MTNENNTKTVFATIAGRTNVGKSTLLNAIIGSKVSIVSPKPQTTITGVRGVLTRDNTQLVFLDTPGLHSAKSNLNRAMLRSVEEGIADADITIMVVSAAKEPSEFEHNMIKSMKNNGSRAILAINKIDKVAKPEILKTIKVYADLYPFEEIIPVSAAKGEGIQLLIEQLEKRAIFSPFFYDKEHTTSTPPALFACEIVREKMLYLLGEEVPHSIMLTVEKQKDSADLFSCEMVIYCSKESHKGIVIGKNGAMIKKISSAARAELIYHFKKSVYIKCFVKVKRDWQNNNAMIARLGL